MSAELKQSVAPTVSDLRIQELRDRLVEQSRVHVRRIILPEAALDDRVLEAAVQVHASGFANPVLFGSRSEIVERVRAASLSLEGLEILDPAEHSDLGRRVAERLVRMRAERRGSQVSAPKDEGGEARAVTDPLLFAALLLSEGLVDGSLSGIASNSVNVLRAALRGVGLKPGIPKATSVGFVVGNNPDIGDCGLVLVADCAAVIEPTAEELVDVARTSADIARKYAGIEPKIALLSFSTHGSATHPLAEKMRKAWELVRAAEPDLAIDGEVQADSALVPWVCAQKAPNSSLKGRANILVFPDLNSANIGYKLVNRLGLAQTIGPIMPGLAAPFNDMSRGSSVQEIFDAIALTAAQANHEAGLIAD